jgi:hypothetical protein
MEVSVQLHDPCRFPPGDRTPVTLLRVGGPQSRSGDCGVEKNLLPLQGIEPQLSSPQRNTFWAVPDLQWRLLFTKIAVFGKHSTRCPFSSSLAKHRGCLLPLGKTCVFALEALQHPAGLNHTADIKGSAVLKDGPHGARALRSDYQCRRPTAQCMLFWKLR